MAEKLLDSTHYTCQTGFLSEVALDYFPENISDYDPEIKNSTLSALHIRFIAIDKQYQKKNIGTVAMNVMIKRAEDLALQWPIRLITIDARKELVEWYKKIGFHEMMINSPGQDGVTVAMYYDCMKYSEQLSRYCSENV